MTNEMITIMDNNGENAVMGRELHAFLEVKTQYSTWLNRMIVAAGFEENKDFGTVFKNVYRADGTKMPQPQEDHILNMDSAKSIAMLQHSDKGRMIRDYFIASEKKLRALQIAKAVEAAQATLALPSSLTQELVELKRTNKTLVQVNAELAAKMQTDHQILLGLDSRMKNFASVMQAWAESAKTTDIIDFSNPTEPKVEYRAMSKWFTDLKPKMVYAYNKKLQAAGYLQYVDDGWRRTKLTPDEMATEYKYSGKYQIRWSRKGIDEIVAPTCKLTMKK